MSQSFLTNVPVTGSVRDPSYVDAYVNQIRLSSTIGDVTLVFGIAEDIGLGRMVSRDRAAIRLSMSTAKALLLNLQAAIGGYEAAVGAIPLPFGAIESIADIRDKIETSLRQLLMGQPLGNAPDAAG